MLANDNTLKIVTAPSYFFISLILESICFQSDQMEFLILSLIYHLYYFLDPFDPLQSFDTNDLL